MRKIKLIVLLSVFIVVGISTASIYALTSNTYDHKLPQSETKYSYEINNNIKDWSQISFAGKKPPLAVPFIIINKVSVGRQEDSFIVRYDLGDKLPINTAALPILEGDKIRSVEFNMDIDENYFDQEGNKNPGVTDIRLKTSFYGYASSKDTGGIVVQGKLVEGGPGYDYFVASYPAKEIFMYSQEPKIVFKTWATATSNSWQAGVSDFEFANKEYAATAENDREIYVKL